MKKIFFFVTTLMLSMSSFAALTYNEPASTWEVGDTATLNNSKWNSLTTTKYAIVSDDWYVMSCYDLYKAKKEVLKWIDYTANGASNASWNANGIFQGKAYYEAKPDGKTCCTRTDRIYSYKVTNMAAMMLYCRANAEGQTITVEVYDGAKLAASAVTTTISDTILAIKGLDATKTYTIAVGGSGDTGGKQNSFLYEIAFSISGNDPVVVERPVAPNFSVKGGKYYDPFKVQLAAVNVDAIYYNINDGEFVEYTDSIEIVEYDTFNIKAFSYKEGMEMPYSDTVSIQYILEVFVPRTAFNAREELVFAGIQADDIEILDASVAELATAAFDGANVPVINYKTRKNYDGSQDSTMCISLKSQPGFKFIYKNQANKNAILKFGPNFIATDGNNFEMHLDSTCGLQPLDTIIFVVTAKGSNIPFFDYEYSTSSNIMPYQNMEDKANFTTGYVFTESDARIEDDYSGWTNLVYTVNETKKTIKLKETAAGFRIAKILIGAYRGDAPSEGVENVNANVKAVKRIVNGQVVIVKGNRMFNVLGAEITK